MLAQRVDQLRSLLGIPGAEDRGLHFAAVRPLDERDGELAVGRADDAPARARGNRRDQPALVGIGIEEQERACGFFAHIPPFAATLRVDR